MTRQPHPSPRRLLPALADELQSLQRAGVTHVPKKTGRRAAPAPTPSAATPISSGQASSAPPAPKPSAAAPSAPPPAAIQAAAASPTGNTDRSAALSALAQRVAGCVRCAELARIRTQTVFGSGSPQARLVFMGEAPGADEDREGFPFVGRAGQLLTKIIEACGLKRSDVYILNTLKCRPPGNRTPLPDEAANCREYLEEQLAIIRPEFICCLGAVAAQNLLGTDRSIGRLRGSLHEFKGAQVLCTYHPAYLLRNPAAKRDTWDDMKLLLSAMGLQPPRGG